MLLCQLLVNRLTGFRSSGCKRDVRCDGLLLLLWHSEPEMSISGSSPAHTCSDQSIAVLAQSLLLLQRPGNLLPVKFNVRGILRTYRRCGDILAAQTLVLFLAGDIKDEELLPRCSPGALRLVFGDQFAFDGLRRDGLRLTAHLLSWPVLMLSSVHASTPPTVAFLTAAQHQLMGNTSQDQENGDVGKESHEQNT